MDGQSGGNCATNSSFASTLTEADLDPAAATGLDGSADAEAAVRAETPEPCGRFPIYPGKA